MSRINFSPGTPDKTLRTGIVSKCESLGKKGVYFLFTVHKISVLGGRARVCLSCQPCTCINMHDGECTGWTYLSEYSDIASDILAIQMLHFCEVTSVVTLLVSMWHISLWGAYSLLENHYSLLQCSRETEMVNLLYLTEMATERENNAQHFGSFSSLLLSRALSYQTRLQGWKNSKPLHPCPS